MKIPHIVRLQAMADIYVHALPSIVVGNNPLANRVEACALQPDLGPYSMGIGAMEKRLKSPILAAFWGNS